MMNTYSVLAKILVLTFVVTSIPFCSSSNTSKRYQFNVLYACVCVCLLVVEWKNITRVCSTKAILTVNGEYPGPTIAVNEGDDVEIKVTNGVSINTTIHWHGIKQLRTGWADGPAYVTQCPITPGRSYTYKFTVTGQRGTLWWHAHIAWQRATVYGAIIIYPRMPYPFAAPVEAEIPIIFGEWWNLPVEGIEDEMYKYGSGPNSSDAYTINGLPGSLYPCSVKDTFIQTVEHDKIYMLRIINAALNDELFFAISNHTLTVVEVDASYTKPFDTEAIMITPGQTYTVLLNTNQHKPDSSGLFVMAARPYLTTVFPFDNSTTIGFLKYKGSKAEHMVLPKPSNLVLPRHLPRMEDHAYATKFVSKLRSLGTTRYPCKVPKKIDKRVVITISLNLQDCPANETCKGFNEKRYAASMNNQSFVRPMTSILEWHYKNYSSMQYSHDFPLQPPHVFDYTGVDPLTHNLNPNFGTKLFAVEYGTRLEIVLQDTSFLNLENHPIHIHGHNFFVVGRGFGNFNAEKDTTQYNLVDPPERNTVGVPMGGWAAIRINADNPGVWFMHCHLEEHTSWGLASGFIVKDGVKPSQRLLPPPDDLPPC
ncbi:laccase-1 isoform X1 [Helianthus annuus]|uniref:laccase-1 isoform X1 n=1 Tax=Helianthus annuus TaxID=4232 RepID=UPI001652D7DF|nr:laccase-1 isoform X1 [Helianthus annuus]